MGAFTVSSTAVQTLNGTVREAIVTVTGPASYDTGGSTVDLAHANFGPFTSVYGAEVVGNTAAGDGKYKLCFIPAAANAPSTPKVQVYDMTQHPGAEVASTTNLSGSSWRLKVFGA